MSKTRSVVGWGCVLLIGALAACAGKTEAPFAWTKADRFVLYEGLPHQTFEPEQLAQEQARQDTVTHHDYQFYRSPLEIPTEDAEKLKVLLGSESSFRPWRGEKKCGGFHPDFGAEFHVGTAVYRILICFSCREVKIFGPNTDLRYDVEEETSAQLKTLLQKHRKNRPATEER